MGIQLDWKIEAREKSQRDQEDPESRKRRRRARMQLVMAGMLVAVVVCVVAGAILYRLRFVEDRVEDDLLAAVDAELAAIRIGNEDAFMRMQRSDSQPWLEGQRGTFLEYQSLKENERFSPQTKVVDVEIDEERARVIVQEEIDGRPYQQVWFYWHYQAVELGEEQAGWRRVPPDVTFWGDQQTIENANSSVTYYDLDEDIATALAERVESWWGGGCDLLGCESPVGHLELNIDPAAGTRLGWDENSAWRLNMVSPRLSARVPVDGEIPAALEGEVAAVLARRLLEHASGGTADFGAENLLALNFDTDWLKAQLRGWLIAEFRGLPSPFLQTSISVFGDSVPGDLLRALNGPGQINTMAPIFNPSTATLTDVDILLLNQVEWSEFFTWRLELERRRLNDNDYANFYTLYELGNFNQVAEARAFDATYRAMPTETVQAVTLSFRDDGKMTALVDAVDVNQTAFQITFVWNGDTFVRAN
jgi:hypothetical protein